jgi:4'-phosphopantetheinyl transferase
VDSLITDFFSKSEQHEYQNLPGSTQLSAFFTGWVRKEAFMKGLGRGFSVPLDSFDVTLNPGESAALLAFDTHSSELQNWQLMDINPRDGFVGALAVGGGQHSFDVFYYDLKMGRK